MVVVLLDSAYNRSKGVVGMNGTVKYAGHTLGTLIKTFDGIWLYYFRGKEEFKEILGRVDI